MDYVIIDESGRFSDPNTKYIIFAAITTESLVGLDKIIPKVRKKIPKKGKRKKELKLAEIKFSRTGDKTKEAAMKEISKLNIEVYILAVDTQKRLVKDNPENYSILVSKLLSRIIKKNPTLKHTIIDRHFTWVNQREHFNDLLQKRVNRELFIEHLDSQENTIVSLADFVAGAEREYYAKGEDRWRNLIKHKIVFEKKVFWKDLIKRKKVKA